MSPSLTLNVNEKSYHYYPLASLPQEKVNKLPYSLKILLENILRYQDGLNVTQKDIDALLNWDPKKEPDQEISFTPSRVILQDFTGVPVVVDLAAMREAMKALGGDPKKINPLSAVDLVIDHSVMVDRFDAKALAENTRLEFQRNEERYTFLRWGQTAFENFRVVPPGTGIVHQVNLEYLASVAFTKKVGDKTWVYPDTLVGTDSHTTMINGLGVLGWGVGGIEAEAAMLGQPVTMLIPQVVGFELKGALPEGATATDLVLSVVEKLRHHGVVGKFVEFFGSGLKHLPLADRATIANMAPEYGATCGIFPIDEETLNFLRLSGRSEEQLQLVEAYAKTQGLFLSNEHTAHYSSVLSLDLSTVEPCIAGPKRPQDRITLQSTKQAFAQLFEPGLIEKAKTPCTIAPNTQLTHGDVVIAAITSCTNTSNPAVMLQAGLLAKKALDLGLKTKPWVKTSLAPGSQVVTDYLNKANLTKPLEALGFYLVGYGCTTCIGNSGPLPQEVSESIIKGQLGVAAVLSGNRNFEGRIHPEVRFAYLASPPLVVAYALAGTMNIDFYHEPIGYSESGKAIYLKDIWPSQSEVLAAIASFVNPEMFQSRYAHVFDGTPEWQGLEIPVGNLYEWNEDSTYVKNPPYFEGMKREPEAIVDIERARVLALLGDSVTTDHISPAGDIALNSAAGHYLQSQGVDKIDFNSYGSRRGNHEVMMRGTFANIRLRNQLAPGTEGGVTTYLPTGEITSIYDASMRYQSEQCPLIIIAGSEYGTGSSRDWAAKGTRLLGVRAVIAASFERIHRSNLIGMGVLPLQFLEGHSLSTFGLTGKEYFSLSLSSLKPQGTLEVTAVDEQGTSKTFSVLVRIDTPKELDYYEHGGILPYVVRQLL